MGLKRTGGFEQLRNIMKATVQFILQMFDSFEKDFTQFFFYVTDRYQFII